MPRAVLYINRDPEYDWPIAVEFGRVVDGQPDDHLRRVGEDFAYVLDRPGGMTVGFGVGDLTTFDVEALPELWERASTRRCSDCATCRPRRSCSRPKRGSRRSRR